MSDFYQRFERLCIEKGVSPSRAAMDIGLSNAAASGWADGSKPRKTTIRKLAEYFNVPYFYLSGEKEQKEPPTTLANSEGLRSTDYDKLNEANRAIIDDLIAKLVKAQSEE